MLGSAYAAEKESRYIRGRCYCNSSEQEVKVAETDVMSSGDRDGYVIYLRVKAVELASMSLIWRRGKSGNNPGVLFQGLGCCFVFQLLSLLPL